MPDQPKVLETAATPDGITPTPPPSPLPQTGNNAGGGLPPSSPPSGEKGIDEFFGELSQQILVASQNGLFNVINNMNYKNRIDELMCAANESQAKKETHKFGQQVYEMRRVFDEAWNNAPKWWRIIYERGMIHLLANFVSTYGTFYCLIRLSPFFEARIPVWICSFGVCGAALQVIYSLVKQINRRSLRRVWVVQCLFAPVLGVLLSIGIYLAIKGGLMVFGADKAASSLNENVIAVFCLYAGYKWEWALNKLNELVGAAK